MFTKEFWQAAAERAIKAFAQTFALLLGAGQADVTHIPWTTDLKLAGVALILSVATSIGSTAVTGGNGPSLTKSENVTTGPAVNA